MSLLSPGLGKAGTGSELWGWILVLSYCENKYVGLIIEYSVFHSVLFIVISFVVMCTSYIALKGRLCLEKLF